MPDFSSKELYMMNGGKKQYIYLEGWGDIYNATPKEEEEWAKEIIDKNLLQIDTETNSVSLKFAIESLVFHDYQNLQALLMQKMESATPSRKIVFATCLWNIAKYEKSYSIIYEVLLQHRKECIDEVFSALQDFKDNYHARKFLVSLLEGNDDELFPKAQVTITMWAYTGLPVLRDDGLVDKLKTEQKGSAGFQTALEKLKKILFSKK